VNHFLERLFISSLSVALIALLLVFSDLFFVRGLITLVVAGLSGVALWEYLELVKAKQYASPRFVLIGLGVLVTASFSYDSAIALIFLFLSFFVLVGFQMKKVSDALVESALSLFGLLYIAVPLGMILALLDVEGGHFWIIYLISVVKSADIWGYLGGSLWGRRKLAARVSPSKTLEGGICGMAASLGMSFFLSRFGMLPPFEWVGLGFILGAVAIFGDLVESLFKRDAGKKDSNRIPGIGGVLDLLDSLLFATPIIYFYIYL
jgi:phosphatidate cytidylyltransferase